LEAKQNRCPCTGAPVKLVGLVYCGEFNGQAVFFDLMVIKFLLSFE
jgi:hypothetical protein